MSGTQHKLDTLVLTFGSHSINIVQFLVHPYDCCFGLQMETIFNIFHKNFWKLQGNLSERFVFEIQGDKFS